MGRWGGGRKEQRPIVTKHPSMEGRKKPGLRGGDEAMPALYTRTLTGVMKGGKKKRKKRRRVANMFFAQLNPKIGHVWNVRPSLLAVTEPCGQSSCSAGSV